MIWLYLIVWPVLYIFLDHWPHVAIPAIPGHGDVTEFNIQLPRGNLSRHALAGVAPGVLKTVGFPCRLK